MKCKYYKCLECESVIDIESAPERGGESDCPPEIYCPLCGSSDITCADECMICGEINELDNMQNCLCEECQEEVKSKLNSVIELFVNRAMSDKPSGEIEEEIKEFINSVM